MHFDALYADSPCVENPSVRLMLRTRLLCSITRAEENGSADDQKKRQILVADLFACVLSVDIE